jgi:hypothetical protein
MPATESTIILCHRRGTKREGIQVMLWGVFSSGVMVALTLLVPLPGLFWRESPVFFCVFNAIVLFIAGVAIFAYALPNILLDREFRFTIFDNRVECMSPAKAFGESYSIPVDEIVAIEKEPWGDDGDWKWFFRTADGRRIQITQNYRNPIHKIVAALQELRPDLHVKRA